MVPHLITICVGFIIAFGLQQLVELFLSRRRERQQRAANETEKSRDSHDPPASTTSKD